MLECPPRRPARPAGGQGRPAGRPSSVRPRRSPARRPRAVRSAHRLVVAPRRGRLFSRPAVEPRGDAAEPVSGSAVIESSTSSIRRPPISCSRSACRNAGRSGSCRYRSYSRGLIRWRTISSICGTTSSRQNASDSWQQVPGVRGQSCAAWISSSAVRSGSSCCSAWARTASHGASCRSLGRSGIASGTSRARSGLACLAQLGALAELRRRRRPRARPGSAAPGPARPVTTWMVFFSRPRVAPV